MVRQAFRVFRVSLFAIVAQLTSLTVFAQSNHCLFVECASELALWRYEETNYNPVLHLNQFVMKETGPFLGLMGSVAYYDQLFIKLEGRVRVGSIKYESRTTGTSCGITNMVSDVRGLVGWNLYYFALRITPYSGLGYRHLYDYSFNSGRTTSTGAVGYDREANYIYSPFGVEVFYPIDGQWAVGGGAQYDLFWRGFQESHLEQTRVFLDNPVVNKQNTGYGVRVSIKVIRQLHTSDNKLVVEPYFQYWCIDESEPSLTFTSGPIGAPKGFREPDNITNESGVKFALQF